MKLIFRTILFSALFIFFSFGIFFISILFAFKAYAGNYSPNDFQLENFEIQAGIDKNYGRYYTYHYEFIE